MPDRGVALRGLSTYAPTSRATAHRAEAPRATAPRHQRGFSLLELLVALIVVVLVTTLVNFSVSSGGQDVRLQAQVYELAEVASYALDEAQMTGVDYGLLLEEEAEAGETIHSFSWLEHRIDGWSEPLSGKEVFAKQRLPAGVALELELEDSPLTEDSPDEADDLKSADETDAADDKDKEDAIQPQVVLYASGETTVGAINVRQVEGGDLLWRVEWDLLGRFKVLRRGEEVAESDQQEEDR